MFISGCYSYKLNVYSRLIPNIMKKTDMSSKKLPVLNQRMLEEYIRAEIATCL